LVKLSCSDLTICLGLSASGNDVVFDSDLCEEVDVSFEMVEKPRRGG